MTDLILERPVGAACRSTGEVGTGRHVGAGERAQVVHELLAGGALRHIAAVQQQVGTAGKRRAPLRQFTGAHEQRGGVESHAAELHCAVAAVAQHMHGTDVGAAVQGLADAADAVFAGVDAHDFNRPAGIALRLQVVDQRLRLRQRQVDKRDLHRRRGGRRRLLRLQQTLIAGPGQAEACQRGGCEVGRIQDARLEFLEHRAGGS